MKSVVYENALGQAFLNGIVPDVGLFDVGPLALLQPSPGLPVGEFGASQNEPRLGMLQLTVSQCSGPGRSP